MNTELRDRKLVPAQLLIDHLPVGQNDKGLEKKL